MAVRGSLSVIAAPRKTARADLAGKVVVITGASSGIARATAHAFAAEGARLVLAARRAEALAEAARECEALGGAALAVPTDTGSAAEVEALAAAALARFGHIDVWVNAAAVLHYGRFDETPTEVLEQVIRTNVLGYFHGAQAALRHFRARGRGTLINVGSVLGLMGHYGTAAYVASKYAILGLGGTLREELQDQPHVHACEVLPAAMDTPIYRHAANHTGRMVHPMQPLYRPERVARAIVSRAKRPRARAYVGGVARLGAMGHLVAPRLSERIVRAVARSMEIGRKPAPPTTGNLMAPVRDGWTVDGGWRRQYRRDGLRIGGGLVLGVAAGVALGLALRTRAPAL